MSFTNDVKKELCGCEVPDDLRETLRYGMIYGFKGDEPYYLTRDKHTAGYVKRMFSKNSMELRAANVRGGDGCCMVLRDKLLTDRYVYGDSAVNSDFVGGSDAEVGMFLRGVFLTCGSVNVQRAGYHFELTPSCREKCDVLHRLINEQGMSVNISHRGSAYFLYCKNSESISDILTFMGAVKSAMEIMNIKIIKEVRSNINRSVNCETANIDRTVRASSKQLEDIRLVLDNVGPEKLPSDLREIAELRLENPDMSLRDLGMLAEPNISRSGVNHRFERLARLAEEIKSG